MPIFKILRDSVGHRTFVTAKTEQSNNTQSNIKKAAKLSINQSKPHIIKDSQNHTLKCSTKLWFLFTFLRLKKKKVTENLWVTKQPLLATPITCDNTAADNANPGNIWLFAAQQPISKLFYGPTYKKFLAAQQPPFLLKPSSTVTGFKKYMYSSVKYNDNQLQPGYNRRKFNHSHYNQTLKENSRLSKVYANLSTTQLLNYLAFTGKNTISTQDYNLNHILTWQSQILPNDKPDCKSVGSSKATTKAASFNFKNQRGLVSNIPDQAPTKKSNRNLRVSCIGDNYQIDLATKSRLENARKLTDQHSSSFLSQNRTIPKLVNFLESRLAVIIWRSIFSKSIANSKQKLRAGTLVNGSIQKKASFLTLPGDVLCFSTCNTKQRLKYLHEKI